MADNTLINPGSGGDLIGTDDIGGVKYQIIKVGWGPDGAVAFLDDANTKRLPVNLGQIANTLIGPNGGLMVEDVTAPASITLLASQTSAVTNTTTTRGTTTTGLGKYNNGLILVNITGAGSGTATLNLYLQDSIDGGTTWNDLIATPNYLFGTGVTTMVFALSGTIATTIAAGSAQTQETMPVGTMRYGPWSDRIRVREKVSGVSGSPGAVTYGVTAVFKR